MNRKGYALLAVLGLTLLITALSMLAFQSAQVQSFALVAEVRGRKAAGEVQGAVAAAGRVLQNPEVAWTFADRTNVIDLLSLSNLKTRARDALEDYLCGLSLPGYDGVWLNAYTAGRVYACAGGSAPVPSAAAPPPAPEMETRGLAAGWLYKVPFVLHGVAGGTDAPLKQAVAAGEFYLYAAPYASKAHSLVVERAADTVVLTPLSVVSGPALVNAENGLVVQGRPGVYGPVSFFGTGNPTFVKPRNMKDLTPSPDRPCYQGACPHVSLGIAWRKDTGGLDLTRFRGARRPHAGVLWTSFPGGSVWPRVQVGTKEETVCTREENGSRTCGTVQVPVYDYAPWDAGELVLEAVSSAGSPMPVMRATFLFENGARAALLYRKDASGSFQVKNDSCQGCVPDPAWNKWTDLGPEAYVGREGRRVKLVRVAGGGEVTVDTFVWSGGDVTLAGSVRTTPNACALYTPTVGAPPDVNCAPNPNAVRFHLDAGESGTITLTGLPSTVLGFLAGRRLVAAQEDLMVRVVGGAHLVEGFSGSFQFYHDPNYIESAGLLGHAKEYAAVRIAPPSPWSP